jgi:hypothetical protein
MVGGAPLARTETKQQTRFTDTRVADEKKLEEKVAEGRGVGTRSVMIII